MGNQPLTQRRAMPDPKPTPTGKGLIEDMRTLLLLGGIVAASLPCGLVAYLLLQ